MTVVRHLYDGRMDAELRHLRALVAVVDHGTFTDAAIELKLSQASVSRSVAALENVLGVRLLDRSSRHVALTPAGERALAHARRAIADVSLFRRAAVGAGGELRVGYAWSALGRHTTDLQRRWAAEHPQLPLVLVQSNTPTAGLNEGTCELAVVRRSLADVRFATALIGTEARYAVVAADDRLARRRSVRLADFAARTVAVDSQTGTTTPDLWPADAAPAATRATHGVDEWLTLIAAGQAVGMTAEATVAQHPRPGVVYRRVRDAPPVSVWLAWWRNDPPARSEAFLRLARRAYQTA